jgi:hypothetical protein
LHHHLNPETILISQTFDIDIYLKAPKFTIDSNGYATDYQGVDTEVSFLTIKDCRINGMNGTIAPGQLLEEPLSFMGLLAVNTALAEADREGFDSYFKDGKPA